jgi:Fibronectin type III domain
MPFLNRIGSGATNKFGFRMGFVPGAPTSVTASLPSTYGNTTASVSWTAPVTVGSPAFYDYTVQYSSNGGSSWTTFSDSVSTGTSVTVTGLTNGTEYVFRVAAVNTIGTGTYSTSSNSVTPLFGKVPTPIVGDIAETTSTIHGVIPTISLTVSSKLTTAELLRTTTTAIMLMRQMTSQVAAMDGLVLVKMSLGKPMFTYQNQVGPILMLYTYPRQRIQLPHQLRLQSFLQSSLRLLPQSAQQKLVATELLYVPLVAVCVLKVNVVAYANHASQIL